MDVDQATISRWEQGRIVPDLRIQRRLRELLRREVRDEHMILHSATASMHEICISDPNRVVIAASEPYCRAHGMHRAELIGQSAHPMYTEMAERFRTMLYTDGFYSGEIASAISVCRSHSLSGHERNRPTKAVWVPLRLSDGSIALHAERVTLSEGEFEKETGGEAGLIRIQRLDDLLGA